MTVASLPNVANSEHPLDTRAAARDLWPRDTLRWWQGEPVPEPERVFWPETDDEVCAVLSAASQQGRTVITWGAGSGVCGGTRGVPGAWVLDTKRMDTIGSLDAERRTVRVQAGVIGQHLEDWLAERGFTLGHSPSSIGCSTVGGWAAARGAGQFSSRYGVFEDMVLAMTVCTPGRGRVTVGMGGDAPDEWMALLLGSEGTLGVITEVMLRVHPLPEVRWLRGYAFPDVQSAVATMRELMQAELWPSVLRLYDPVDTRIGGKTRPKKDASSGPSVFTRLRHAAERTPGLGNRMLGIPLALPRLLNRIADGAADDVLLIVGWEGRTAVVDALVAAGRPILEATGRDLGAEPGERWYASRHAVSYKLMPLFLGGAFADTMEVACPWSRVVPLYDAVRDAVRGRALVMAHMSHLYPEGGSIYFSFAGTGDVSVYDSLWQRALDAVLAAGGTITHHHGVGRLKQVHATREASTAAVAWSELAASLDPNSTLNPDLLYAEPTAYPVPAVDLEPEDGLVEVSARSSLEDRAALVYPAMVRWPWRTPSGRPRWTRQPWQTTWVGVRATVQDVPVYLGRGPRSASGPDLRGAVVALDEHARCEVATVGTGERWMGAMRSADAWRLAQDILRADLRPSRLGVVDGVLHVGFVGPAATALGALAADVVGADLQEVPWCEVPLACGPMRPCDISDEGVVAVTEQCAWRPDER